LKLAFLQIEGLTKFFHGLAAVQDVDFFIRCGEKVGLIGPNGAGKTTLFNLISGVYRPTRGKVFFREEEITGSFPHEIARKGIGRTFQDTRIFEEETIFQNLKMGCHGWLHSGLGGALFRTSAFMKEERLSREKAREILSLMGLLSLKEEKARNVPQSARKKLAIALALAAEPKLLLLDEPFAGLNPQEAEEVMSLIDKTWTRGATLLLIEHNMRVVKNLCERIIVLNFGQKIGEGTFAEISRNTQVIEAYLGSESVF
jgi:branched-chain amino acid transport system ATP-binding protein